MVLVWKWSSYVREVFTVFKARTASLVSMPRTPITHPHDFLVKATLGRKEVMHDFLESRLPKETLQYMAMDSLKLTNKSFTPRTGKSKHSDPIYAVTTDGQDGYLYISMKAYSLPLIVDICLYNGPQPYQGSVTLLELYEPLR